MVAALRSAVTYTNTYLVYDVRSGFLESLVEHCGNMVLFKVSFS